MRIGPFVSLLLILALGGTYQSHASDVGHASDLALVGARIYLSTSEAPIESGTVVVHDGRILSVGPTAKVKVLRGAKVIDCKGLVVTAGLWNSHIHILTPGLVHADRLSVEETTEQLQEMLTRWGFTTVFDIASVLKNDNLIRRRIASGEVKGPRILTVGEPFWVKTPIYVQKFLKDNDIHIAEVHSAAEARERVRQQIRDGADGIKIFANSVEYKEILTMPLDLAKAIVEEAHKAGKPVFAHVSNNEGISVAIESGVDVLAHTTPTDSAWSPSFAKSLVDAHVALTPTLTLWDAESKKANASQDDIDKGMGRAAAQMEAFVRAGGQVLFGTDVGYIQKFDTSEELEWMSRGGMSFQEILASLTTNPAQRFGYSAHSGRIAKGMDGDLVVLSADPAKDITAFARVRYTIRGGQVIYAANG